VTRVSDLRVKLFADGADLAQMVALRGHPCIRGFTTSPTLMHKAGVRDYRRFAHEVLAAIPDRPVSFEVFSDDFPEMERQARQIAAWGRCVYVITVTPEILEKLDLVGRDLAALSLDTAKMFYSDAVNAGFTLPEEGDPA
jgi:transaldolase